MDYMVAPDIIPNVANLNYPIYIQLLRKGIRTLHIPGTGFITENNKQIPGSYFSELSGINDMVFDGIISNDDSGPKYYIADCIPIEDWNNKSCKKFYSERLKLVREYINGVFANYSKYCDEYTVKVDNSAELIEFYKSALDDGFFGLTIRNINGKYIFGVVDIKSEEMLILKPRKNL